MQLVLLFHKTNAYIYIYIYLNITIIHIIIGNVKFIIQRKRETERGEGGRENGVLESIPRTFV